MTIVPPTFIIGVFAQPISSFAKWKARGINTLVSHEPEGGKTPKAAWEAAAEAAGLFFMDYPSEDDTVLPNEANQTHRLAFMQDDEPDLTRTPNTATTNADGWTKPELLAARYARCKLAAPTVPMFVNFAGTAVTPDAYPGNKHLPYIAAADWLSHDWYVKNKNYQRYPTSFIAKAIDRLRAWSNGKPQFAFIECSDQKISTLGRCPTADEVEDEINIAINDGAKGIIYFPQRPPSAFLYDAIPDDIVARITQINARLSAPNGATPTPPAQNEPTTAQLQAQITTLTAQLQALSKDHDLLKNRKYKIAADVQVIDP